jgi:hypothetical protein
VLYEVCKYSSTSDVYKQSSLTDWPHLSLFTLYDSKNYAKGFSDVQIKVREATSNDAWGPSGTLMNEIAQATYNQ